MIQILEDLEIVCVAPDDHFPKNITKESSYPVVGVSSHEIRVDDAGKMDPQGKKVKSVIKFLVINDDNKLQQIADFNCYVRISDAKKKG